MSWGKRLSAVAVDPRSVDEVELAELLTEPGAPKAPARVARAWFAERDAPTGG